MLQAHTDRFFGVHDLVTNLVRILFRNCIVSFILCSSIDFPTDIACQPVNPSWRHLRKIFQVELSGTKRLEATTHVRREEVACMLRAIHAQSMLSEGPVNVQAQVNSLISNIVSRMVLNKRFVGVLDVNTAEHSEAQEFRETIEEWAKLRGGFSVGDYIPALAWVDVVQGYARRCRKVHKRMDAFVTRIIAEHRARRENGNYGRLAESEKDMVDVLLDEHEAKSSGYQPTADNIKGVIMVSDAPFPLDLTLAMLKSGFLG